MKNIEKMTEHVQDFLVALCGRKGDIDAWLECNDEQEIRIAMFGALFAQREKIATWLEPQRNDIPASGAEFANALRADDSIVALCDQPELSMSMFANRADYEAAMHQISQIANPN